MSFRPKATSEYKNMTVQDILANLETTGGGLAAEEAARRIQTFGYNDIEETKANGLWEFLKRYWGPMPWLLEFAIVLTIILNHHTESVIIFVLLTINAVIGHVQSQKSKNAVNLLKRKLEINAKVLRDGEWTLVEAKEIVPGDVLKLKLGDLVAADVAILQGDVSIDESALTGESLPKEMHPADLIYSGSIVKRGEADCVAVNTGANTFFGKTVELVKIAKPKSKQQELMFNIVRYMMYLGIAASVVVSVYAFILHKDVLFILSFIVIFLIGAIPVALPAVLTIVQAVGALELSHKGVLVTKLDSIEDAASIDIFCFDKTGTITQNKLTVVESMAFGGFHREDVVKMAALASREEGMDAIDLSILDYSKVVEVDLTGYEKISYYPFNPESKKTEAVVRFKGRTNRIIKGAAQTILALCDDMDEAVLAETNLVIEGFSQKGFRTIAVARSEEESGSRYKLIGFLAIADPPRADSKTLIEAISALGIKSLMLTGDSVSIAREIAMQVGIGDRVHRVGELDGLSHDEQLKLIEESDGFAEVYPEDKYKIVKLLQDNGHTIGMTGDGVNDSPALKQADLGTAVSEATDVARASASIVLTQPGLGEIIDAVEVSRKTYQRILTWVINKIVKVVEVVVLFTVGFFWTDQIVISLLGMSLLVFANDFVTMMISTDNVKSTKSPNQWHIKNITMSSSLLGILFAVEDLLLIFIGTTFFQLEFAQIQTLVLLSLVFNTQFRILSVRERGHFWSSPPNKKLLAVNLGTIVGFVILGLAGVILAPLPLQVVAAVLGTALVGILVIDQIKYRLFKVFEL